jgi:4-amino-4-deoxy-L-arabinose transferase-like glycosyltransferase
MNKTALNREYFLAFFILWVFFYLVFPSWLLPVSAASRVLIYIALWVFFLANGGLFYKWNKSYARERLFIITKSRALSFIRENKILVIVLLFFSVLQIYPMLMPIRTRGDEAYHADNGLEILRVVNIKVGRFLPIDFHWFFKLSAILLIVLFILLRRSKTKYGISSFIKRNKFLLISILVVFFLLSFIIVFELPYFPRLHRFPPVSKLIHSFSYLLFYPTEFVVRLPQLIFTVLAAVFLFKTGSLFRERREALFAALTFLCLPAVVHFANDGELEAGVVFFIILVSYFFMRHLKSGDHKDFMLTIFFLGLGFLYKRPLLIMIPLIWFFLFSGKLIKFDKSFPGRFLYYLKFTWIGLVPIIPWLVITKFLPGRHYTFSVKNWSDPNIAFLYLKDFPQSTGLFLALVMIISFIYCLIGKRDWLFKYYLALFALIYILISSDYELYRFQHIEFRFAYYFSPSIAVFASAVFFACLKNIRKRSVRVTAGSLLFLLLFLHSSLIPPRYTGIGQKYVTFHKMKSQYVPYDKALFYISKNFPPETRFHVAFGPNPVNFYAYKYNALNQRYKLDPKENFDKKTWKYPEDQTIDNLYSYLIKNKIDYFMHPSSEWVEWYMSESLIDDLRDEEEAGHRFRMIKQFEFGGNSIYLFKVLK